jgi:hypothetical protein
MTRHDHLTGRFHALPGPINTLLRRPAGDRRPHLHDRPAMPHGVARHHVPERGGRMRPAPHSAESVAEKLLAIYGYIGAGWFARSCHKNECLNDHDRAEWRAVITVLDRRVR